MKKFDQTASVNDLTTETRVHLGHSIEKIAAGRANVKENWTISILNWRQEIGVSTTTMQRILTKDLKLYAYKVQLTQDLKPEVRGERIIFVNWILEQLETTNLLDIIAYTVFSHLLNPVTSSHLITHTYGSL